MVTASIGPHRHRSAPVMTPPTPAPEPLPGPSGTRSPHRTIAVFPGFLAANVRRRDPRRGAHEIFRNASSKLPRMASVVFSGRVTIPSGRETWLSNAAATTPEAGGHTPPPPREGASARTDGADFMSTAPAPTIPGIDPAAWDPDAVFATESDRLDFWASAAARLEWADPWHTIHSSTGVDATARRGPDLRWFEGGRLNAAVNCADRHVDAGLGDKVALHFEGEPGDRRTVTYQELQELVSQAANALLALGIGKGDRVVIYLPVLVETIVITLACARIGAVHSLVFGGFSAEALKFRVEDTRAKLLVTTDGQYRRGTAVPVKANADEAVSGENAIEHVLVINRTGHTDINWVEGRDVWWHDVVDTQPRVHQAEAFDAETPLFIMYTSGTTGQPKGLVHTTGGYLTQASFSHSYLFSNPDPDARAEDVHWCTADLAWVTAHTYEIYGPLSNGVTQVIYEGVPNAPHPGRHFEVIERYGVTSYYTAPTLVR